jgi:CheY-like chemotaxis protein
MGKTLLLADDSVTIQKVVGISFASEDIAIKSVDNGDDAISRARELRPDIILADVVMPGKSGYEVCEAIKGDAELRHIPVLLLTGTFEAFDEDRAQRAGAAGHIAKPFEAQTLVERVKQLLAQPPTMASAAPPAPTAAPQTQAAEPAPASGGEDAFDFFDDPAPEALEAQSDLEMDDPGDAFAFDEDDLGGAPEFASSPSAGAPEFASSPSAGPQEPVAHTVAILPDAAESDDFDDADLEPMAPESLGQALDSATPADPAAGEGFDFQFESMPSAPAPAAQDAGSEDFAESVLLDPSGDSAYDVSSSQLGDLSVEPESAPPPEAPRQVEPPPAQPSPPAAPPPLQPPQAPPAAPPPLQPPQAQPAAPPPLQPSQAQPSAPPLQPPQAQPSAPPLQPPQSPAAAEPPPVTPPAMPGESAAPPPLPQLPPDPAPETPATDPVDASPAGPSGAFVDEVPTQPPSQPLSHAAEPMSPAAADDPADPEPEWPEPETDAPAWPETSGEVEAGAAERSRSDAGESATATGVEISDDALAQIAPALRQQLHETLEKIAWEAFGQVTETVVAQTVERLEKIAWEVVPKLAETLIAEEIRKLKDDA